MRLNFFRKRPDRLMSQPYSPTGKRFTRPIIYGALKRKPPQQMPVEPKPQPTPAPVDHHREEIRRIIVALGLWIAFLLMLWRLIREHAGGAEKFLLP